MINKNIAKMICFGMVAGMQSANTGMITDRGVLLAAVQQYGHALQYANDFLRRDRRVAVQRDGVALEYADDTLKQDRDVVMIAVQQYGHALKYVDYSFRRDRDVVLITVQQYGDALQYANDFLRRDRRVAVQRDGVALEYADDILKQDRDVVMIAVQQYGHALKYIDYSFRRDRGIVLIAVLQNYRVFADSPPHFHTDAEIVAAVTKRGETEQAYELMHKNRMSRLCRTIFMLSRIRKNRKSVRL